MSRPVARLDRVAVADRPQRECRDLHEVSAIRAANAAEVVYIELVTPSALANSVAGRVVSGSLDLPGLGLWP
jgi:hypothetical protein